MAFRLKAAYGALLQYKGGARRDVSVVTFSPLPREISGTILDEEAVELVLLGWFELRVRALHIPGSSMHSTGARSMRPGC